MAKPPQGHSSELDDNDLHLFNEGRHFHLYDKLGAHPTGVDGTPWTRFAVWAPSADRVSVIGDFNGWDPKAQPLSRRGESGIWEAWVPEVGHGALYKYAIRSANGGRELVKTDPLATRMQCPPDTASVVWDWEYRWDDGPWLASRRGRNALGAPISIYELHLGSWRRAADGSHLSYRELAEPLVEHIRELGFTHVELMPVMEHPFYGSWGYQVTGYFAPTSRYGSPQDLMYLIDTLHQAEIGVILDWVPSHFPTDANGLATFDGTHLYEHEDPRRGYHPDWKSAIFNYGRHEVQSFLVSSALYWLEVFHADGLRVDGVASMLYNDYSREQGQWLPNEHGGRENLEAIALLRVMNEEIYRRQPDVQTFAEESTAWPMVSQPTWLGGLGFGLKWDMGWMHDTLEYLRHDPIHRRFHHQKLTFRGMYFASENFTLALSHDEVVHGKGSLAGKMPGDEWRRFANLRLLYAYQYAQPGKKLLFMGAELATAREWDHDSELGWALLERPQHAGVARVVADLNRLYREQAALHEGDCEEAGFLWIDADDTEQSVLSFLRRGADEREVILVVLNFTPVRRLGYRVGVPYDGRWDELLNTDAESYGGSGAGNFGGVVTDAAPVHGRERSLELTLPPLGAVFLKWAGIGGSSAASDDGAGG